VDECGLRSQGICGEISVFSDQDQGRRPNGLGFRLRRVTWKNTPSNQGCLLLVGPFLRQGSFTSVSLRGPAAIRHPWRGAALAASMPLGPLHETCVQPAPKSRLAVFGLFAYEDQRQIKGKSKACRLTPVPLGARGVLVGLALAGKPLISIVSIVPTLCVGMHPLTLRVTATTGVQALIVGPALAGKPLISIVSIVPTLCVGMHPLTLRVIATTGVQALIVGPALAGKPLISIVSIVPTLCVGMHPLTLCVIATTGVQALIVGPALAGKASAVTPQN
jgi:hypothetical protein